MSSESFFKCLFPYLKSNDEQAPSKNPKGSEIVDAKCADKYIIGETLGKGGFSVVKNGKSRSDGKEYAIKIFTKADLAPEDELGLKDEIKILYSLDHPNIYKLFENFHEPEHYYLVLEKLNGGELFDRIVKKETYSEKEARDVSKILFDTIAYCHSKKVAHRDLKPENLLLTEMHEDTRIKIADFGFAKVEEIPYSLKTQLGTPTYVAPEILSGNPYGTQVDNWSLGVILYILLGGYPPFDGTRKRVMFEKICRADFEFHEKYWSGISKESQNLIKSLLTPDPRKRMTSKEALDDEWIQHSNETLKQRDLAKNLEKFKKFNAQRKFRAAVNAVIAVNRVGSLSLTNKR